uniref:Uncharacterized protein n=1 Tax=Arundo donax TaxID=35708 RepID=A0A0A9DL48_ARUDO
MPNQNRTEDTRAVDCYVSEQNRCSKTSRTVAFQTSKIFRHRANQAWALGAQDICWQRRSSLEFVYCFPWAH